MKTRQGFILTALLAVTAAACGGGTGATTEVLQSTDRVATTVSTSPTTTTTVEVPVTTPPEGVGSDMKPTKSDPVALTGVKAAFAQTAESSSGRMVGSLSMVGVEGLPGGTMEIPFSGAFAANGDYSFAMDMSVLGAMGGEEIPPEFASMFDEMEIRQIGATSYVKFGFLSMFLGLETEWLAAPVDESSQLTDGFGLATPASPADLLDSFGGADATIADLGPETVNGLDTTHYRLILDTEALYELASPEERAELEAEGIPGIELPMDVWINDEGILVRFVMDIDGSSLTSDEGESFERMLMTYDLFDLGADIDIVAPPASNVTTEDQLGDFLGFGG